MAPQPNDTSAWLSIFRHHMDEMFNYLCHVKGQGGGGVHEFSPQMDVYETADACMIEIDLPGFNGDEFTLTLTGTTLRIEGVKRQDKGGCAMSYICLERHYGRFSRALEIPPGFDANGVRARYERGVLTVTVPRSTTDTASKGE